MVDQFLPNAAPNAIVENSLGVLLRSVIARLLLKIVTVMKIIEAFGILEYIIILIVEMAISNSCSE